MNCIAFIKLSLHNLITNVTRLDIFLSFCLAHFLPRLYETVLSHAYQNVWQKLILNVKFRKIYCLRVEYYKEI